MLMMRRKRLKQSCWRGSGRPNDCRVAQAQSFGDPQAGSLTQHQVGPFAARADGEKKDCCVPDGCTAPRNLMDTRENRRLLDLIKAGKSWVFISANLKRPVKSIRIRLKLLKAKGK
jgi:hypothetical protein